jgi:hypothetical protein
MFSPIKIFALLAILWIVWMLFKFLERRQTLAKDSENSPNDKHTSSPADHAVEVQECSRCRQFVSVSGCGQENCPLRS